MSKQTIRLSGVSTAISTNQQNTLCVSIKNNSGEDLAMRYLDIVYKAGLEDILVEFKTPSSKNNPILSGETTLSNVGLPRTAPSRVPMPLNIGGISPILRKGENFEIYVQTFSTAITSRDISAIIVCESV